MPSYGSLQSVFGVSARGDRPHIHDAVAVDGVEDVVEIDGGIGVRRDQMNAITDRERARRWHGDGGMFVVERGHRGSLDVLHGGKPVVLGHRLVPAVSNAAVGYRAADDGPEHGERLLEGDADTIGVYNRRHPDMRPKTAAEAICTYLEFEEAHDPEAIARAALPLATTAATRHAIADWLAARNAGGAGPA